jgi:hypothetical protein
LAVQRATFFQKGRQQRGLEFVRLVFEIPEDPPFQGHRFVCRQQPVQFRFQ